MRNVLAVVCYIGREVTSETTTNVGDGRPNARRNRMFVLPQPQHHQHDEHDEQDDYYASNCAAYISLRFLIVLLSACTVIDFILITR